MDRAIQAILDGVPGAQLKDKIGGLEARKAELTELLVNAEVPPPLLHPNMAEIYRQRIAALYESLQSENGRAEAAEVFRTLVDQVTLVPDAKELVIVLRGDLAGVLRFAAKKNPDVLSEVGLLGALLSQESLVAGTRNTPTVAIGPTGNPPACMKVGTCDPFVPNVSSNRKDQQNHGVCACLTFLWRSLFTGFQWSTDSWRRRGVLAE
ncbi:hypothetical protein [Bradyrhizobium sp. ERR14]|uniref:hypothetical protein n=1 Tax=Bradyrhizobium sp. ERR14 TaxID=2663837 RepID=UPI0016175378|nr:hypothetical protein [Bradyrhizobium sp. ERR14]